jgi:RNA 3'-terminal phosphate cyclase (ATP)
MREQDALTIGSGGGVVLWAETSKGCFIAGTAVSSKGKDPADIGDTAAKELIRNLEHGGCVDEYLQVGLFPFKAILACGLILCDLQDQIIIFMALAEGISTVRTGPLTLHTR